PTPRAGSSRRRREDDRFIRGQGTFVADVTAPHMAHMAVLRSPLARARIRSINATRAFTLPGVLVVITGELLARRNLAWMPTLSGARQAAVAFAAAAHVTTLDTYYPRCHPAPLECCACFADVDPEEGRARIYLTSQAPHAHRTILAQLMGLPEQQVQIISPDLGGAFGNKVPLYPAYVVTVAASFLLRRPVRWIEDRPGKLLSPGL